MFLFDSFFGRAFEQAAEKTNARTLHDNFDPASKLSVDNFFYLNYNNIMTLQSTKAVTCKNELGNYFVRLMIWKSPYECAR